MAETERIKRTLIVKFQTFGMFYSIFRDYKEEVQGLKKYRTTVKFTFITVEVKNKITPLAAS